MQESRKWYFKYFAKIFSLGAPALGNVLFQATIKQFYCHFTYHVLVHKILAQRVYNPLKITSYD